MEIILNTISLLFFVGLILSPIFILRLVKKSDMKPKFISYLTIGFVVTAMIALIMAWWDDESTIILLRHYDGYWYNPDSDGYQVDYENVLPENIDKVKTLEIKHMGIGWPLKAIMTFIFYSPYLFIVYCLNYLISGIIRRKKTEFQDEK